ncbi:Hypothetical protein CINCED_3A018630 [Cinara cedri]|uniref:Uncharacterized protein n=1 Tax=Cinara cedri TaxID=506608 RepID=A0A5E4LYZ4_9HEMI|nr:Hypothetical protein CINCED_3A018630 [Cinara cedri]
MTLLSVSFRNQPVADSPHGRIGILSWKKAFDLDLRTGGRAAKRLGPGIDTRRWPTIRLREGSQRSAGFQTAYKSIYSIYR